MRRRRIRAAAALSAAAAVLALVSGPASAAGPEGALDARAWELVSPADKNGGAVEAPGGEGAAVLRAAAAGGQIAFGSTASFGEATGAAPVSQYLAGRGAGGWSTQNLTPPLLSGTYAGGAYQLFSTDLSRALLSNGWRCRGGEVECAAQNPPLAPGAPAGYRNLYLREGNAYTPLVSESFPALPPEPEDFELSLQGASPDLAHVVFSADSLLYEWSEGQLTLLDPAPGAQLAAPAGAIAADGSRVYWARGGDLHLSEAGQPTVQVDESLGGGGSFQAASADGSFAFFSKGEHLYRFVAASETTTDLTPGGGVVGALGVSADGSHVYYLTAAGLFLWKEGTTTEVAAAADLSNLPPATGSARVTPDGSRLAFVSSASLTGYPNAGKAEAYLYEAPADRLLCVSCNPKGIAPLGPASIPGALAAGGGPASYKPRVLSADGTRLFFDSADALAPADTGGGLDAYEWQAQGSGGCAKAAGCIGLLSDRRSGEDASFADASADGADAYFLTAASLVGADPGSVDLYDARAGGGFPEPVPPIPCNGDDCQSPPPAPEDPIPGTETFLGPANPPVHYAKRPRKRPHHGKHHRKKRHHADRHQRGSR